MKTAQEILQSAIVLRIFDLVGAADGSTNIPSIKSDLFKIKNNFYGYKTIIDDTSSINFIYSDIKLDQEGISFLAFVAIDSNKETSGWYYCVCLDDSIEDNIIVKEVDLSKALNVESIKESKQILPLSTSLVVDVMGSFEKIWNYNPNFTKYIPSESSIASFQEFINLTELKDDEE